jgi:hypothetical protein
LVNRGFIERGTRGRVFLVVIPETCRDVEDCDNICDTGVARRVLYYKYLNEFVKTSEEANPEKFKF